MNIIDEVVKYTKVIPSTIRQTSLNQYYIDECLTFPDLVLDGYRVKFDQILVGTLINVVAE
jgi:hypothetical protein